ncbi:transcription factor Spi-B [Hoplias malabaricus]|uniref:transcription factor Spi-B n=1 Tax=Hoplias malabaricus TaxID=27720 RepID=UPI003461F3D1
MEYETLGCYCVVAKLPLSHSVRSRMWSRDYIMFIKMNSSQACQTDLEVILEFLEEHWRHETRRQEDFWNNTDSFKSEQTVGQGYSNASSHLDSQQLLSATKPEKDAAEMMQMNGLDPTLFGVRQSIIQGVYADPSLKPLACPERSLTPLGKSEQIAESLPSSTPAGRGKKLRLFHFLFEMLEDPGMAHCVSWVPSSAGVFQFSSAHKERVAELWGQRKGNRRPMTYQKMSRALRNYTRSGEIIKVRKKLTYQFSRATLSTLRSQQGVKCAPH